MKRWLINYIALLIAVLSVIFSFAGCIDADELMIDMGFYDKKSSVNKNVSVLFRNSAGVICYDKETKRSVMRGTRVTFQIGIDENYVYTGNSVGAEFSEETGKLIIASVDGPMTVDVYVEQKINLHYVEYYVYDAVTGEPTDAATIKLTGSVWEKSEHTVSLEASVDEGYEIVCWSKDSNYVNGHANSNAQLLTDTNILEYAVSDIGIHKIYLNVTQTEAP